MLFNIVSPKVVNILLTSKTQVKVYRVAIWRSSESMKNCINPTLLYTTMWHFLHLTHIQLHYQSKLGDNYQNFVIYCVIIHYGMFDIAQYVKYLLSFHDKSCGIPSPRQVRYHRTIIIKSPPSSASSASHAAWRQKQIKIELFRIPSPFVITTISSMKTSGEFLPF